MAILRFPLVAFGFVVEHLRRLPGGAFVARHSSLIATGLLLLAFLALVVWGLTRAPQRISIAELAAAGLPPTQSWIIISGDLQADRPASFGFRYRLTDPAIPNASVIVQSDVELPLGQTTISGTYVGSREPMQAGFRWVGQMRADPEVAQEQPPPWVALILAVAGLVIGVADRFSYPMFFHEEAHASTRRTMTMGVGVRPPMAKPTGELVPGTLLLKPGEPVELRVAGADHQTLRIYPAHTTVSLGELRRLSGSEPVLRVRQTIGDLDIVFASRDERDAAFGVLAAERREARHLP